MATDACLHTAVSSASCQTSQAPGQGDDTIVRCTLQAERALLYVLGFRFQVDQPTAKLLQFATKYKLDSFYKVTLPNGPKLSQVCAAHSLKSCCNCLASHLLATMPHIDKGTIRTQGLSALPCSCMSSLLGSPASLQPGRSSCCPCRSWQPTS